MCRRLCLAYLVVSSLTILVLSAPSQKRQDSPNDSHIKLFKQSPNPVKISDEDWYATEDDSQNEPTPLKASKENTKSNDGSTLNKNGNSPQAPNHSAFKTICEETDPKGKCLTSQTKTKAGLETHTKQSQDQLLQSIDHLISSQHHLTESEAILIRQMIANMSKTLQELQNAAQKPCTNSNGASGKERMTNHDEGQNIMQGNGKNVDKGYDDGRQITEIEERHITERKVTKKKEKDTKVDMKKEVDSLKGNDDEVKNSIDTQSEENRDRVDESNANTHKKVDSRKRTVGTNENLVPVGTTANYLDGRRADVNYNAGINRPIDDLKEQYPYGKWPEEGDEAEIDNELDSETVTEPGGEEEGSENKEDEYASDYEDDMKQLPETDRPNIHPLLNPEYLENIIKQQQKQKSSYKYENTGHHVQEHVLPAKRSLLHSNSLFINSSSPYEYERFLQ